MGFASPLDVRMGPGVSYQRLLLVSCCALVASTASKEAVYIDEQWHFIGPFLTGKTELDVDPSEVLGGPVSLYFNRSQPFVLYSEIVTGGIVNRWQSIPSSSGRFEIAPTVNWNQLVQQLSEMAVLEFQGWAVGSIRVESKPARVKLQCTGVTTFYLHLDGDGTRTQDLQPHVGDIYQTGRVATYIDLPPGVHHIFLHVRAKAQGAFACKVAKVRPNSAKYPSLELEGVRAAPDLAVGAPTASAVMNRPGVALMGDVLSLSIVNTAKMWVRDVCCEVDGGDGAIVAAGTDQQPLPSGFMMAPGQAVQLPCRMALRKLGGGKPLCAAAQLGQEVKETIQIYVTGCMVKDGNGSNVNSKLHCSKLASKRISHELRCRRLDQSMTMTFLDHDGSAQHAAVIAPLPIGSIPPTAVTPAFNTSAAAIADITARFGLPILLSLHGTGVSASSQADSYKMMPVGSEDYVFGVEGYWVLAPSRHGAHNWQGIGQWHAFAAVRALKRRVATISNCSGVLDAAADARGSSCSGWRSGFHCLPPADPARILFAGHSMGGAGAWHAATAAPDLAIAAAPAAGWLVKENYGDANAFMRLDLSEPLTSPALQAALLTSVRDQRSDLHAKALAGIAVHARVGGEDGTVPAFHSRRMVRMLAEAGAGAAANVLDPPGDQAGMRAAKSGKASKSNALDTRGPVIEEVKGQGHWWWDTKTSNDGGVVNDEIMRSFYAAHRDRLSSAAAMRMLPEADRPGASPLVNVLHALPTAFIISSSNPGLYSSGRAGISILQMVSMRQPAEVRVQMLAQLGSEFESAGTIWSLTTSNVRRLRLAVGALIAVPGTDATGVCAQKSMSAAKLISAPSLPDTLCVDGSHFALAPSSSLHSRQGAAVSPATVTHICRGRGPAAWTVCYNSSYSSNTSVSTVSVAANGAASAPSAVQTSDCRAAGWGEWDFEASERGPHNSGPMRTVTASPFFIVVGTSGPAAATNEYLLAAEYLSQAHGMAFDTFAPIVRDADLVIPPSGGCSWGSRSQQASSDEEPSSATDTGQHAAAGKMVLPCGYNLVLLGGPSHNLWSAHLSNQSVASWPVTFPSASAGSQLIDGAGEGSGSRWSGQRFGFAGCNFTDSGLGGLFTVPWLDTRSYDDVDCGTASTLAASGPCSRARLALVISAVDSDGLQIVMRLAVPTIPPMVRAPFTNLFPDVVVASNRILREGHAGLVAAGYWDADWSWDAEASFLDSSVCSDGFR